MYKSQKYMVSTFEGIDIDIKYDKDMGKLVKHIIIVNVEAILIDLEVLMVLSFSFFFRIFLICLTVFDSLPM